MGPETVWTDRAFEVSAPAKAIVCGEHAVVYGKSAVAVALSLRTSLLVQPLSTPDNASLVRLSLPDLQHDLEWDSAKLPWKVFRASTTEADHRPTAEQMVAVDSAVTTACACPTTKGGPLCRAVARAFLFLYMSLTSASAPGCSFVLRSEIPIGAGLGSSGSICVCLATAFLARAKRIRHVDLSAADLDAVNRWALAGEVCTHGTPSGVDNAISTWGGVLSYRRATSPPPSPSPPSTSNSSSSSSNIAPYMQFLPSHPQPHSSATPGAALSDLSHVLLVDTNHPRSTRAQLDKVAAFIKHHPVYAAALLAAIDALSLEAARLFAGDPHNNNNNKDDGSNNDSPSSPSSSTHPITRLGTLMQLNHRLLSALGVSHPALDRVCDIVARKGVGYAKLTGAGGGGCVLVLLKPGVVGGLQGREDGAAGGGGGDGGGEEALEEAKEELRAEGFRVLGARIGGAGVGVRVVEGREEAEAEVDAEAETEAEVEVEVEEGG
ncbi:mevalonate kinase [Diplodia corticola]|uniref:mevalonate kinase n=1 Tax=Diplodia corticola TaxID=236234 RepID=A0A1J9SAD6_9PEZI|nr:mevalonate kinase [Diplodia corticola]OJD36533.1 mevalonate kinase [Diplodia corticola]